MQWTEEKKWSSSRTAVLRPEKKSRTQLIEDIDFGYRHVIDFGYRHVIDMMILFEHDTACPSF
jgi:hypothetical protein